MKEVLQRVASAQSNSTLSGKEWIIEVKADPASGIDIVRYVSIEFNDGLCRLAVQKRINGTRLTSIHCPGMRISSSNNIDVKFDTHDTSRWMNLNSFSDVDNEADTHRAYIGTSGNYDMKYNEFIRGLTIGNVVAMRIPLTYEESFWTSFSLAKSTEAIGLLGIAYKKRQTERKTAEDIERKEEEKQLAKQRKILAEYALERQIFPIRNAIFSYWSTAEQYASDLETIIQVKVSKSGDVLSTKIAISSGNEKFDNSFERAITEASPLPIPNNPDSYPYIKEFQIKFRPPTE